MKKTILKKTAVLILSAVLTMSFAGCHQNNGNDKQESTVSVESTITDPLAGQWQSEQLPDYIYTFNGDGTGKYDMAGNVLDLSYETEDGKITLTFLVEGYTPVTLDYEIDGDRLNIKDSFGKDTFYLKVKN